MFLASQPLHLFAVVLRQPSRENVRVGDRKVADFRFDSWTRHLLLCYWERFFTHVSIGAKQPTQQGLREKFCQRLLRPTLPEIKWRQNRSSPGFGLDNELVYYSTTNCVPILLIKCAWTYRSSRARVRCTPWSPLSWALSLIIVVTQPYKTLPTEPKGRLGVRVTRRRALGLSWKWTYRIEQWSSG